MIISFAWTTKALLQGKKTVTRRDWSYDYAMRFAPGDQCTAYDKSPRSKGKPVAIIEIEEIYQERLSAMPPNDVQAEGGLWKDKAEFISLFNDPGLVVWVIRFKVIKKIRKRRQV